MKATEDAAMKTKVVGKHWDGCGAVRMCRLHGWASPFCPIPEKDWKSLDRAGGRRGTGTPWLVFRCNDTACECEVWVRAHDLIGEVQKHIDAGGAR